MPLEPNEELELPDPQFVESSDGVSLAVYDLGGDGPDVLFAHATGFCAGVFLPITAHMTVGRLAALDFRGHGRSTIPDDGMDWRGTGSDVLATIDALGLVRPIGVGHSMGGAALTLAEEAEPGTFSGLWLFEPIIFPAELRGMAGDNPLVEGALRRRSTFEDAQAAISNFASKPPFAVLDPDALAAYVRYGFQENPDGTVSLRCRPETESATYEGGARHDAFEHLGEVTTPTVVVRGKDAPVTPAGLATLIAESIPNGRLEDHPDLGHFGPLQDPEAMARSITEHVTAVTG